MTQDFRGSPAPDLSGAVQPIDSSLTKAALVDQAYQEYWDRREAGETVDADEFCAGFPYVRTSLGKVIQWHIYLEENPGLCEEHETAVCWPEAGEPFLDYQLLLELGKGALARVFLAREPKLGSRLVAVKVAMRGSAEAKVLGQLKHRNIMPVYSVHEEAETGLTVICMPYVGSATLEDVHDRARAAAGEKSGQLILDAARMLPHRLDTPVEPPAADAVLGNRTWVEAIRILGVQLAEALAFMHARGICHRDLKLSNVLLTPAGMPLLLDFNLSAAPQDSPTECGGTLPYMSPEQLRATDPRGTKDLSKLDARSDLYSLGVILYQLLTGTHPFGPLPLKLTEQELRAHLLGRQMSAPVPIDYLNKEVSPALSRLIESCLASAPDQRPASAAAIAAALRPAFVRSPRLRQRVLVATGVILLSLGLVGAAAMRNAPSRATPMDAGLEAYQQGQYRAALEHLHVAVDSDANDIPAHLALDRVYQKMGNHLAAFADYRKIQVLAPQDGRTHASLGYCANCLDMQLPVAIEYYTEALHCGFDRAEVHNNLGYCRLQRNDPNEDDVAKSLKHLTRAVELDPQLQAAHYNRALAYGTQALVQFHRLASPKAPKEMRAEAARNLKAGIADMKEALALGRSTADMHYEAARLFMLSRRIGMRRWTLPHSRKPSKQWRLD